MKNFSKLEKRLNDWLAQSERLRLRSEEKLLAYADLPIRKFSNPSVEKAAGYIRVPPSNSLDNLGLIDLASGVKKLHLREEGAHRLIGNAAGYWYLSFRTNMAAYEQGITEHCPVLGDWAAALYFLMASMQEHEIQKELAEKIWQLHHAGQFRHPGSKLSVFCLADIAWDQQSHNMAMDILANSKPSIKDSNHLIELYQEMFVLLSSDNTSAAVYESIIAQALERHLQEAAQPESDEEFFDFSWEAWSIFPSEVMAYALRLEKTKGIRITFPPNPAGDICRLFLKHPTPVLYTETAAKVQARATQVLLNRQVM